MLYNGFWLILEGETMFSSPHTKFNILKGREWKAFVKPNIDYLGVNTQIAGAPIQQASIRQSSSIECAKHIMIHSCCTKLNEVST